MVDSGTKDANDRGRNIKFGTSRDSIVLSLSKAFLMFLALWLMSKSKVAARDCPPLKGLLESLIISVWFSNVCNFISLVWLNFKNSTPVRHFNWNGKIFTFFVRDFFFFFSSWLSSEENVFSGEWSFLLGCHCFLCLPICLETIMLMWSVVRSTENECFIAPSNWILINPPNTSDMKIIIITAGLGPC